MKKLSEEIADVFDSLIGSAVNSNYTPQGIRTSSNQTLDLENLSGSDRSLDIEKLEAIKQSTSKGFRVIDINPNLFTRADFSCVYTDTVLRDYVGNDNVLELSTVKYDNEGSPVTFQTTQAPYWRTYSIPIQGDFVKIEYLPIRQNPSFNSAFRGDVYIQPQVEPQNCTDQDGSDGYFNSGQISSDNIILVDFENPSSSPLIAKNGQVFKTYFTTLYVTFKQLSPRIRITVGVGSTIEDNTEQINNLSIWNGKSFTRNSLQAPKPFCVNDKDITYTGGFQGIPLSPIVVGTYSFSEIIRNDEYFNPFSGTLLEPGLSVFWITQFSAKINFQNYPLAGSEIIADFDVDLVIMDTTTGLLTNVVERIATINCTAINSAVGTFASNTTFDPCEPIRVVMKQNQSLYLRILAISNVGPPNRYLKFTLSGYAHGSLNSVFSSPEGAFSVHIAPYYLSKSLAENPYPADLDRKGAPNV